MPLLLHRGDAIMQQWSRVKRWHSRLTEYALEEKLWDQSDFYLSFFTNCLSLRDWLEAVGIEREDTKKLFGSKELKICRDLANGVKHLQLKRPSVDPHIFICAEAGWREGERHLVCVAEYERFSAYKLANACFKQLEEFLNKHELVIN